MSGTSWGGSWRYAWSTPSLRFIAHGAPGAYLRVLQEGQIRAGDGIEIVHRPDHDVTVGLALRALTVERDLISRLAPALPAFPDKDRGRLAELVQSVRN